MECLEPAFYCCLKTVNLSTCLFERHDMSAYMLNMSTYAIGFITLWNRRFSEI